MPSKRDIRQWTTLYRGLGNQNRLRILQLLKERKRLSVSELARELNITIKNTSRNLNILSNLDLVRFQGGQGRVYYFLNSRMPVEISKILEISIA